VVIGGDLVQVWRDEVDALSPKKFLPSPPKCEISGGRRGEFQYLNHGFRVGLYIGLVDFVDFDI